MCNVSGVMQLADAEGPRKRPPPRLESLKIRKEQEVTRKEDIDEKMRQVEERRKVKRTETQSTTLFFQIHKIIVKIYIQIKKGSMCFQTN